MKEIARILAVEPRGTYRHWSWWRIHIAGGAPYDTMDDDFAALAQLACAVNQPMELHSAGDFQPRELLAIRLPEAITR